MPRFYLDTSHSGRDLVDTEGLRFRDFEAARREAVQALLAIAADETPRTAGQFACIRIRDERRREVYVASLTFEERHALTAAASAIRASGSRAVPDPAAPRPAGLQDVTRRRAADAATGRRRGLVPNLDEDHA